MTVKMPIYLLSHLKEEKNDKSILPTQSNIQEHSPTNYHSTDDRQILRWALRSALDNYTSKAKKSEKNEYEPSYQKWIPSTKHGWGRSEFWMCVEFISFLHV